MANTKRVHVETFEEYRERFKEHFQMERTEDGILTVKVSTQGGPAVWSYQLHNAMCELWTAIGHDKDTELLILSAEGDNWIAGRSRNPSTRWSGTRTTSSVLTTASSTPPR